MKLTKTLAAIAVLSCCSAFGTVLNPGDSGLVSPTTVGALGVVGGPVATSSVAFSSAVGSKKVAGTLISAVYQTGGGTYDFFYQIQQSPKPADNQAISSFTAPIDGAFFTDVSYLSPSTGLMGSPFFTPSTYGAGIQAGTPTFASRDTSGITFLLHPLAVKNTATNSAIFVVATNSLTYAGGQADTVSSSSVSATASTFSPTPEPGFYGMLATGLAGLFFVVSSRKRRVRNNS